MPISDSDCSSLKSKVLRTRVGSRRVQWAVARGDVLDNTGVASIGPSDRFGDIGQLLSNVESDGKVFDLAKAERQARVIFTAFAGDGEEGGCAREHAVADSAAVDGVCASDLDFEADTIFMR
jgi:hypothetical protein